MVGRRQSIRQVSGLRLRGQIQFPCTVMNIKCSSLRSRFVIGLLMALSTIASLRAAPVVVDTSSAGTVDGFDLYGNGLVWWTGGYPGDEVIRRTDGIIAIRSALPGVGLTVRPSRTFNAVLSPSVTSTLNGVVRTDSDLFFFGNSLGLRIFRRPIFGQAESALGIDFSGVSYSQVGAMLQYGNTLLWSVVQGGQSQVRIKALNGPPGGGDEILFQGVGLAKKMVVTRVPQSDAPDFYYLVLLANDGSVWKYVLDPAIQRPGPTFVANNVTDIAVREETHDVSGPIFIQLRHTSVIYAATGANLSNNRGSGKLVAFDLGNGSTYTDYDTRDINLQITGVAVDSDRIFLTQTPVTPGSGLFASRLDLPNSQLLRRGAPSNGSFFGVTDYATIAVQQEGRNLRSDRQWLYWANGNQIRKIKTDAPALELDYRAIGLEAVQTVQDYNNSIPLVAYKGTIVRAYAQLLKNTTGLGNFAPNAQLRGFLNGAELPVSPIYPYSDAVVDTASDLPTLRANLSRSFNFQLPDEWLAQVGTLRLEFTVNPTGSVPETGVGPLNNNSAAATLTIVAPRRPCVVFKTMRSSIPNYDMFAPNSGFGAIVDRANSMLPLDHLKTFFSPGAVVRPQFTLLGFKDRSFDIPSDADQALDELDEAQEDSHDPPGCTDVHWAGMFPPGVENFNGLGERPGNSLILRMDAVGSRGGIWGSIVGGHTLAHELGHNYGRKHIDQTTSPTGCGTNKPAGDLDVEPGGQDPCTLGITDLTNAGAPIGYDWLTDTLILPSASADMMTYGSPRWVSPFSWNALVASIPAGVSSLGDSTGGTHAALANVPAAPAMIGPHPAIFRVTGTIYPETGEAVLLPAWQYPAGTLDPVKVQRSLDAAAALPVDAPYRLRLLGDPQAAPLLEQPVAVSSTSEGPAEVLRFSQAVPYVEGVTRIQLVTEGKVLAEIVAGANSPVLKLDAPVIDLDAHTLRLSWTGTDADGDALLFTTQFSNDDGATWQALQVRDPSPGMVVSTTLLRGGAQCRLRVLATDGLHTEIAITEPFALPKQAPILQIHGVRNQQAFPSTAPINARAIAYDPDDGSLDPSAIHWALAGPESRSGVGENLTLRSLAPGTYDLTVTAADSDGATGSANVQLRVLPVEIPEGPAPVLDGLAADAAYATAALVRIRPNNGNRTPTDVRLVHSGGYLYVAFTDLAYTTTPNLPASVGIYFDLDGSRDANSQSSDVGFGISEDGILSQVAGNGSGMVVQPVASGFTGAVVLGDGAWSAELRIADSLLAGWNHESGFMIVHYFPNLFAQVKIWPPAADVNHPNTWTSAALGPLAAQPNRPPVALASAPSLLVLGEPQTVTLDGSASYDLDGDALTYTWRQIDGPPVTLKNPDSAQPSFETTTLTAAARLRFELIVGDAVSKSAPAEATVELTTVAPLPPAASPELSIAPVHGGLTLTAAPGQYDRQSIATETTSSDYGWIGAGANPVTYALTLTKFPGTAFAGFQAHIFLVPDTSGNVAPDYEDPNIVMFDIQALPDGTATGWFRYKTNEPSANAFLYSAGTLGQVDSASGVIGTWSMSFVNDSGVTLTAPNGASSAITIPDGGALPLLFGGKVTAFFGVQANTPDQVGQSAEFGRIQIEGTPRAAAIDDSFPGPDLNPAGGGRAWTWVKQAAAPDSIQVAGEAAGYALSWTLPDTGFVLQTSSSLAAGSWTDVNIAGASSAGSVKTLTLHAADLGGKTSFYRLIKKP